MLVWTTALAVALGSLHYMRDGWLPFHHPRWDIVVVFGSFALVAVSSLVLSLCNGLLLLRLFFPALMIALGAILLGRALRNDSPWFFGLLLGLMSAWITASLLVVRHAGYRLAWQWRFGRRSLGQSPCEPGGE
jgi:ABC-type spermidine/putrescine transport system permease subunit II